MKHVTWLSSEDLLLTRLKAEGKPWAVIALRLPRHTQSACEQRYYKRNERPTIEPKPRPTRAIVVQQAKNLSPTGRRMSTARLVVDAELRDRIGLQGITAGLLGDPMPG